MLDWGPKRGRTADLLRIGAGEINALHSSSNTKLYCGRQSSGARQQQFPHGGHNPGMIGK